MSLRLSEVVLLADPATVLAEIDRYEATKIVSTLRKSLHVEGALYAVDRISHTLLESMPDDIIFTTIRASVLKDMGLLNESAEMLATRLRGDCNGHFLKVIGSVLWRMRCRTSAHLAFNLADHFSDVGKDEFRLTIETMETLRARLRQTWLPDNAFYRRSEDGPGPIVTDAELETLEAPMPILGLVGFTLRPLKSKRQLARVANQLRNCLNSYLAQITNGTTLLFAVEKEGTPVEAIEVNPYTRSIAQWKGERNAVPNPSTRPMIERALTNISVHRDDTSNTSTRQSKEQH